MRILIVNKYAHVTGGADTHCLALADGLRSRGHEVAFLSTESTENVERAGRFVRGIVTRENRDSLPPLRQAEVAGRALWNVTAFRKMNALVKAFHPDVVHAHKLYPQLSVAPVVAAARAGVPVVQTLHDYEFLSPGWDRERPEWIDTSEDRGSYRALNTATHFVRRTVHARRVACWIGGSRYLADAYARIGITPLVLPNFVTKPPGLHVPSQAERTGVAFVGRLVEQKGVRDLLWVAERLGEVTMTIAGTGPLAGLVHREAARLPNLDYVDFLDRKGVFELFAASLVSLAPARWPEPGGISALESMAVGTPVVAYGTGGLAEYVSDAGGGVVVEPGREALLRSVGDLLRRRDLWEKLSRAAVSGVAARHSRDAFLDAIEPLYQRASAGSRR